MRWVKASAFKADCERVIGEVAATGDGIVVVKNGRPKGRLGRAKAQRSFFFGMDKGKIRILGDIVSPIAGVWETTAKTDRRP